MSSLVTGVLLAGASLGLISLHKAYNHVPDYELKRRARSDDSHAASLYRVVAYGLHSQILFWTLIGATSAVGFVSFAHALPVVLACVVIAAWILIGFVWLAGGPSTRFAQRIASWLAPIFAKLISYIYPVSNWFLSFFHASADLPQTQADLYETEDLLNLLHHQKDAAHSRIPTREIEAAERVLQASNQTVHDIMMPKDSVKLISVEDDVGPLLLDELHKGHGIFMVYEGKRDNLIGTLSLHEGLKAMHGGKVKRVMRPGIGYLHEDQALPHVLQAFVKTKQPLFVVLNKAGEQVGLVSIEGLLSQTLGSLATDEFNAYEDREAVAAYHLEPIPEEVVEEPEVPEQTDGPDEPGESSDPEELPPDSSNEVE